MLVKRIFSGIQPSGVVHIGNYLGALRQWVDLQKPENECLYCIVDLHAITVRQEPKTLSANVFRTAAFLLAAGVDPQRSVLFVQSDVAEHSELAWILQCHAYMGELRRMTQFKDKAEQADAASVGLFSYPILMAADILLYDTDAVPVGEDQKQHLELSRDIARRVNGQYKDVFKIPEPLIPAQGARIMSLDEPDKKMSKSASSVDSWVALDDAPAVVRKKFKVATTDSGREVVYDPEKKAAISNLLTIFSAVSGKPVKDLEAAYAGKGYGDFKKDLGEAVVEFLAPIQARLADWVARPDDVAAILAAGADKARELARRKLSRVKKTVGLGLQVKPTSASAPRP
jgi:tryptophanyl-tRNA synthetase